jgi:hypothetical protein
VADAGALRHPLEHRAAPRIGNARYGPFDKGAVNVMTGNGGADGIEEGEWQVAAPWCACALNDWAAQRNRGFVRCQIAELLQQLLQQQLCSSA